MSYINSKRYEGVQLYHKQNKDISYYIRYRDENGKLQRVKIGDKSKGINEPYCAQKRNEIIHKIKIGEYNAPKNQDNKVGYLISTNLAT